MTLVFVAVAFVAALNAARLRLLLPDHGENGRSSAAVVGLGSLIALSVITLVAALADPLLDALRITDEMWHIAAGLVVIVAGLRYVAAPSTSGEPQLDGYLAALVPVTFPLLVTPEIVMLAVTFSVNESTGRATVGCGIALILFNLVALIPRGAKRGPWLAGARFHGALLTIMGVAIAIEGIRDV